MTEISASKSLFSAYSSGAVATIAYLIGGADKIIVALSILMIIDYVSGVMVGFNTKEINSQRAYKGLFKKVGMLMMIIVAVQIDIITGNENFFMRNSIIMILIGTEGISIMENLGKLGVPVPQALSNSLEQIKSGIKSEEENKDGGKNNGNK